MPAKDKIHDAVAQALIADGWQLMKTPVLKFDNRDLLLDLVAQRTDHDVVAQKGPRTIVVEVKSFGHESPIYALEQAVGQYLLYTYALSHHYPTYTPYIALSTRMWEKIFAGKPMALGFLQRYTIRMVTIDLARQEVAQWID